MARMRSVFARLNYLSAMSLGVVAVAQAQSKFEPVTQPRVAHIEAVTTRTGPMSLTETMTDYLSVKRTLFSSSARIAVQQYWESQGKYLVQFLKESEKGAPWQSVYSSDASVWLYKYYKARSKGGRIIPTQTPTSSDPRARAWDEWIDSKYEYDRFRADQESFDRNSEWRDTIAMRMTTAVKNPGPAPRDLIDLVGEEPPAFFEATKPKNYIITFDDYQVTYRDNVSVRRKYPYYRFNEGVNSPGVAMKRIPREELHSLCTQAGLTHSEAKVLGAVSPLEGGFDSINTYDTGYISAGMLQFASLKDGAGSLGAVMAEFKKFDPAGFEADFQRYGVDVSPDGVLSVVDIYTADEKTGHEANEQVIHDKRLIAVFQRAGLRRPFRIAQLRVAKSMFYPGDNKVTVTIGGKLVAGRVTDVIKSESGLATLMDRKVNTGSISPLNQVLTDTAKKYRVTSIGQLARYEAEIVRRMKYRTDFSKDVSLTQPVLTAPLAVTTHEPTVVAKKSTTTKKVAAPLAAKSKATTKATTKTTKTTKPVVKAKPTKPAKKESTIEIIPPSPQRVARTSPRMSVETEVVEPAAQRIAPVKKAPATRLKVESETMEPTVKRLAPTKKAPATPVKPKTETVAPAKKASTTRVKTEVETIAPSKQRAAKMPSGKPAATKKVATASSSSKRVPRSPKLPQ